jgi:Tfp pilus assembly protein PilN
MKAVNLLPPEGRARRIALPGAVKDPVAAPRSLGAYGVLAALATGVLLAGGWAVTNRQLHDGNADLARSEAAARAAEAKVAALKPYTDFAALSKSRVDTLNQLIKGRFDWSAGLHEVARVVPKDVDLISLVGTVSPNATVQGAGGSGSSLRSALPAPAIDLIGCAKSQSDVARLLARLRAIDGVQRVTLASSEKSDGSGGGDSDCRTTAQMPQFQVTVFFQARDGIVPATAATAPAAATTPATTTPGSTK